MTRRVFYVLLYDMEDAPNLSRKKNHSGREIKETTPEQEPTHILQTNPQAYKPLTDNQEFFCHEYLKDRNGTQAAIRVGYSEKTANEQAAKLLAKVNVRGRINDLIQEQFEKLKIEAQSILKGLLRIAEYDPADAYNEDGTLKNIKDMPLSLRKAIASIEVDELWEGIGKDRKQIGVTTKIRFWNKNEALRDLGRHKKLFVDIVDNPALSNLAAELKAARERRQKCRSK